MEEKLMEKLNSKIEKNETLLWHGRPEEFEYLDKTHAGPLKKKFVINLIIGLAIIGGYIAMAISKQADIKLAAVAILTGFIVYTMVDSKLEANKLKNKCMYGLTDQRMLTVMGDVVFAVNYDVIKEYKFVCDEDGHTSLVCGKAAMGKKNHEHRTATVIGTTLNQDSGLCDNFTMYALPDVEKVKKIVAQHISA